MASLRSWLLVLPPCCVAVLMGLEGIILAPRLGGVSATVAAAAAGVVGTLVFSTVILRLLEARDRAVCRALEAERRQTEQLEALSAATLTLTSEMELSVVLQRVVDLSRRIVGARYGALAALSPEGFITRFVTSGLEPAVRTHLGPPPQARGLLGAVVRQRQALLVDDVTRDNRFSGFPPGHPPMRALLAVPVVYGDDVIGALYLAEGDSPRTFSEADKAVLERFARQAAVAVANARLFAAARRVAALEERQRIAMDLHDGALQTIYGASLALQGALVGCRTDPEGARRSAELVLDRLDAATSDLRSLLTERAAENRRESGFVDSMQQLLDASTGSAIRGNLAAEGEFGDVPPSVLWQLWHLAYEALANAIRHGGPRSVDLQLQRGLGRLRLSVRDDGAGFDPQAAPETGHDGLAGMRQRAEGLGGRLTVVSAPGCGTTIVADVPVGAFQPPSAGVSLPPRER